MGIENLKRWHWVVIAVGVGLLAAWVQLQVGPQGLQSRYATIGQDELESHALGVQRWGRSRYPVENIEVYPVEGGRTMVTADVPDRAGPKRDEGRRWTLRYLKHQLVTSTPYVPITPLPDPPHLRYRFDAQDRRTNPGRDVRVGGWEPAGRGARDPGADGAEFEFPLRRAAADLTVRVAQESAARGADLKLTLNGKPVGSLKPDARDGAAWRAAVPAEFFVDGKQTLKIARGATAVAVAGIDLINPRYGVADFLADAKQRNAKLDYAYKGSWEPAKAYAYWTIGSLIVVGGIWPTVLNLLIGAGLGRPAKEPEYDLSRFKGEPEKAAAPPAAADGASLQSMTDQLEADLLAGAAARGAAAEEAAEAERVRVLDTSPVESAAVAGADADKEYGGEYYPVVRKVERGEHKHGE